jgi:hypothetical protein
MVTTPPETDAASRFRLTADCRLLTALMLSTAVIGTGSLGGHHARVHAALAAEGRASFIAACDTN